MKPLLLKLYAAAFIIGIIGAGSAFAQHTLNFKVPFDFQVGNEKFEAGKYQMRVLETSKYILKNTETKRSIFISAAAQAGQEPSAKIEKLMFNRYGKTYFLRQVFPVRGSVGSELTLSRAEKDTRKTFFEENPRIAGKKAEPEQVSISSDK